MHSFAQIKEAHESARTGISTKDLKDLTRQISHLAESVQKVIGNCPCLYARTNAWTQTFLQTCTTGGQNGEGIEGVGLGCARRLSQAPRTIKRASRFWKVQKFQWQITMITQMS